MNSATLVNGRARGANSDPAAMSDLMGTQHQPQDSSKASLLDEIVERQAALGARYMPAMSIEQAIERHKLLKRYIGEVLVEGEDYGKIPGAEKPTLLKPGAEKLCTLFGYAPHYHVEKIEDWMGDRHGEPLFYYLYTCTLSQNGNAVGEGQGSSNSWEKKYRWRDAQRTCPQCGAATIFKSKNQPEWFCWSKKGGCGATFALDDAVITKQETGRVANPDFADVINTCQKMGQKRAYIAATLSATGASQYFTQDMDDQKVDPNPSWTGIDVGANKPGTKEAQQYVAERRIEELQRKPVASESEKPWRNFGQMREAFDQLREKVGETAYFAELDRAKVGSPAQFKTTAMALECYARLLAIAQKEVA